MLKLNEYTFEELKEGDSFELTKRITLEDIKSFCALTGDYHPLHSDQTYALQHGFKDVIAHGALVTSYSSTLIGMKLPGKNALVLSQTFNYSKPTYPGDELTIIGTIKSLDKRFKTILVSVVIQNQEKIKIANGKWQVLLRET